MLSQKSAAKYLKVALVTFIALRKTDSSFPPHIRRGKGMYFKKADFDAYRIVLDNRGRNNSKSYCRECKAFLIAHLAPPPATAIAPIPEDWQPYSEFLEMKNITSPLRQ